MTGKSKLTHFFCLLMLSCASSAFAAKAYMESVPTPELTKNNKYYNKYQQGTQEEAEMVTGVLKKTFRKYADKYPIPGFISSSPIDKVAKVSGPISQNFYSFRIGDLLFLRWEGSPGPREGAVYNTYTPALVLQNIDDPTDFRVIKQPSGNGKLPEDYHLAGFFYESTGTIKVTHIREGLVEAVITGLEGQITVGDELMPFLKPVPELHPVSGGVQLAAAVVSGSPPNRVSTTERSYIYINRGSRDGIKPGRVFEAVERVRMDSGSTSFAPEVSAGEAMVVYTTDAYSTAVIIKQFDVIRIGGLLRTKQETDETPNLSMYGGFKRRSASHKEFTPSTKDPTMEVPDIERLHEATDDTLPDPQRARNAKPQLSDLDALEQSLNVKDLTSKEKSNLNLLSKQQNIKGEEDTDSTEESDTSTTGNSFRKDDDGKKKKKTKKTLKKRNEEEELNLLMMQN